MSIGSIAITAAWTPVKDVNDPQHTLGELGSGERVLILGPSYHHDWFMRVMHPRFGPCQVFSTKLIPYREAT